MSKEKFVVETILHLAEGRYITPSDKISDLKYEDYGLSRATAWRIMKELEKCGYIKRGWIHDAPTSKRWQLTEELKMRFAQIQLNRDEQFWRDLDSILVFGDKGFEKNIRDRVHKLLGK